MGDLRRGDTPAGVAPGNASAVLWSLIQQTYENGFLLERCVAKVHGAEMSDEPLSVNDSQVGHSLQGDLGYLRSAVDRISLAVDCLVRELGYPIDEA